MTSATPAVDFGERMKLAVTLFNDNRFPECERELNTMLGYPELPRYYRIKCHIVLAECQEDWYTAEREHQIADNMWWNARIMWPIDTANASTNWLLAKLRTMLDSLRASLEEHRPLDSWEHEEAVEEHAAELAEGNQEMLAEMAEFDPFEPEPGQDQGVIEADQQKEEAEEGQEKEVLESFQEKEVLESIQEKEEPEAGQERDINGFHGGEALPIRLPEAKVQDFADVHGAGKFEGSPRGDARLSLIESLREPTSANRSPGFVEADQQGERRRVQDIDHEARQQDYDRQAEDIDRQTRNWPQKEPSPPTEKRSLTSRILRRPSTLRTKKSSTDVQEGGSFRRTLKGSLPRGVSMHSLGAIFNPDHQAEEETNKQKKKKRRE